jgi:hypothetical protein
MGRAMRAGLGQGGYFARCSRSGDERETMAPLAANLVEEAALPAKE